VIEGLEGGRFAFVTKAHHCMVDGAGGMQLMGQQLSRDPNDAAVAQRLWGLSDEWVSRAGAPDWP
jgi:hypothetical protein